MSTHVCASGSSCSGTGQSTCGSGKTCQNGVCVTGTACTGTGQSTCGSGKTCQNGVCVSTDENGGDISSQCTPETEAEDCPGGTCDPDTFTCVGDGGDISSQCTPETEAEDCPGGTCDPDTFTCVGGGNIPNGPINGLLVCSCALVPCNGNPCEQVLDYLSEVWDKYRQIKLAFIDFYKTMLAEPRSNVLKQLAYSRKMTNECSLVSSAYDQDARLLSCSRVEDEMI